MSYKMPWRFFAIYICIFLLMYLIVSSLIFLGYLSSFFNYDVIIKNYSYLDNIKSISENMGQDISKKYILNANWSIIIYIFSLLILLLFAIFTKMLEARIFLDARKILYNIIFIVVIIPFIQYAIIFHPIHIGNNSNITFKVPYSIPIIIIEIAARLTMGLILFFLSAVFLKNIRFILYNQK